MISVLACIRAWTLAGASTALCFWGSHVLYPHGVSIGSGVKKCVCEFSAGVLCNGLFFWVENSHHGFFFFWGGGGWSSDMSCIFWVLQSIEVLNLPLLGVENFDTRYLFGCKISGSCIFLGSQYDAPSDPRHVYCELPPWGIVQSCGLIYTPPPPQTSSTHNI